MDISTRGRSPGGLTLTTVKRMTRTMHRGYGVRTVVWVRSPHASELHGALSGRGGAVTLVEPGLLRVTGLTAAEIGDLAVERGAPIHELRTTRRCARRET